MTEYKRLKIETQSQTNTDRQLTRAQWAESQKTQPAFMENENDKKHEVFPRGTLLFHHVFDFGGSVLRQLQVEDPLHEHLSVAVEIQGVWVADDLIVRVRVQQHRHVAASGPNLNVTEVGRSSLRWCQCRTLVSLQPSDTPQ